MSVEFISPLASPFERSKPVLAGIDRVAGLGQCVDQTMLTPQPTHWKRGRRPWAATTSGEANNT